MNNTNSDDIEIIINYNSCSRNVIERLQPEALAERREEVNQNTDYQHNVDKFEKEVKQRLTGSVQAKQNSTFFAGVAVAVFASVVGLISLGLL